MVASFETLMVITRTYITCSYSILWYDWIITLNRERRLIWRGPWSGVKTLYVLVRYWMLLFSIFSMVAGWAEVSFSTCQQLVHWLAAVPGVVGVGASSILAVRMYAIWSRPPWMRYLIAVLLLVESVSNIAGAVIIQPVKLPVNTGPCVPRSPNVAHRINSIYFLLTAVADLTFTSLSVFKALQLIRQGSGHSRVTHILHIFARDGILYSAVVTFVWLLEMAFALQPIEEIQTMNAPFAYAISSIMACRLVLSLRHVSEMDSVLNASNVACYQNTPRISGGRASNSLVRIEFSDLEVGHASAHKGDSESPTEEEKTPRGQTHTSAMQDARRVDANLLHVPPQRGPFSHQYM